MNKSHENQDTNIVANTQIIRSFLPTIGSLRMNPKGIPHTSTAINNQEKTFSGVM